MTSPPERFRISNKKYPNMSISSFDQSVKFSLGNFDLRVEAQGSLLGVKLRKHPTRAQLKSIRDDENDEWYRARKAIQALVKEGMLGYDPHLVQFEKQKIRFLDYAVPQARRSSITNFSKKSRLRLLRTCSKLDLALYGLFLTFTYRENMTDARTAKDHLEKLSLWLKRNYPENAFIWRMEYQERGAIHFHIIALNRAFIPAQKLTSYWQKLTGDKSYPDIKKLRSRRKVMYYISKYIAKVTQTGSNVGCGVTYSRAWWDKEKKSKEITPLTETEQAQLVALDNQREQHAESGIGLVSEPYSDNYVGRFWGVINRAKLPLAPLKVVEIKDFSQKVFFQYKRYARRYWKFLSRRLQNFYLFVDSAQRWLDLLNFIVLEC